MDFILFDILAALTGWVYLRLRYRDKDTRSTMLHTEYGDSYSLAGKEKGLQLFAMILLILITLMLASLLVFGIKSLFN